MNIVLYNLPILEKELIELTQTKIFYNKSYEDAVKVTINKKNNNNERFLTK